MRSASVVPAPGPRRRKVSCGLVVLGFLAIAGASGLLAWQFVRPGGKGIAVRISPAQLETALQQAFPVDRHEFLIDVHLSDPTVALNPVASDRIGFGTAVGVSARGRKLANGTVEASGKLRYEASTGTFYLDSPKIESLKIDRVGGVEAAMARKAVTYVLQKAVRHLPVDQLDPNDPVQKLAKRGIRSVRVVDGAVEITLGLNP